MHNFETVYNFPVNDYTSVVTFLCRLRMTGDRDQDGTGMDWPGGGEARVGAGLLSWIQIGSMAQLNITRIDKHLKLLVIQ